MRSAILALFLLFVVMIMVGCAPPVRTLQIRTSGLTGCPPDSIKISDVKVTRTTGSYKAECGGKTFYCSGDDDFNNLVCTEAK